MKKLITIIVVIILAINMKAQDIILTKDGQKIEAKIEEIGVKTVKYKKFSNQGGTSYLIKKNDITSIKYENGDIEAFNEKAANLQSDETANLKIKYEGQVEIGNNYQVSYYKQTYYLSGFSCELAKSIITYDFMFFNGININKRAFIGVGIGIEGAFWKERWFGSYYERKTSTLAMPILGRIKVSILKNTKVNPFVLLNVGYDIMLISDFKKGFEDNSYNRSGTIINPCFGIDFNFIRKIGLYVYSGYHVHINKDSQINTNKSIHSASLKFGIRF